MLANIKISVKIYGLAIILLVLMAFASSIGIFQMNKIGGEIVDIAEVDMPLTEKITKITIHQLEQAIMLERGFSVGGQLLTNPGAAKHYQEIVEEFKNLGHKVATVLKETEETLSKEIKVAHTPEIKKEFEHLLSVLTKVDAEHAEYEQLSEQAFELLGRGELKNPGDVAAKIGREENQIIQELEAALEEIAKFTQDALLTAERHEQSGIQMLMISTGIALFVGIVLAYLLIRSITKPVMSMTEAMGDLADGDLTVEIPGIGRGDEIGDMAGAVQIFKENAVERARLETEQEAQKKRGEEEKHAAMNKMANDFQSTVGKVIQSVSSAATEMQASAETMTSVADQTSSQASNVASASDQAAANVQTVAAAAEELSSSINEIARQVSTAQSANEDAVSKAGKSERTVQELVISAQKIGEVVALISDVAEQTNLLALNATIEAARAGDAGKGFAVVASEVKNLANQTARATEEIRDQISNIQGVAEDAAASIRDIGGSIAIVSENTTGVSVAVEEQDAATQEIARNVEQAAAGTQDVAANVNMVTQGATETGSAATQMLSTAKELSQQSELLNSEVGKFLDGVRSGEAA